MKKKIITLVVTLTALGVGVACFALGTFDPELATNIKYKDKLIKDVFTDKAMYSLKEEVNIDIKLDKDFKNERDGKLFIYFKHLGKTVDEKKIKYSLGNGDNDVRLKWNPPEEDFQGYQVEVYAVSGKSVIDNKNTAVDISSSWSKFPRYGYLCEYPKQDKKTTDNIIENLSKYHINGLQFYDWQYKHNKPLAGTEANPADKWEDIANRDTYAQTIKDYISSAHTKNIKAANYNLMFGGFDGYEADGAKKEWGLYKDCNHEEQAFYPLPATWASSELYIFNPNNKDWQNYIIEQEKAAMKVYDFDAWHVDTLGPIGQLYDYSGKSVELSSGYLDFLNNVKKSLNKSVLFNPVNGYGEIDTDADAQLDFLYKEVWPAQYKTYEDLKLAIDNGAQFSDSKKNIVLAAYMNYGLAANGGNFNEPGVRLTDASIFASGGAHIELGDTGMLCNEYFPNKSLTMSQSLENTMRNYYDFSVAYENLLRDDLQDCNNKVDIIGAKVSDSAEANAIWAFSKQKEKYNVIQLINLIGNNSNEWVDNTGDIKEPQHQNNFKVKYYFSEKAKKVWLASPDLNNGKSTKLKYSTGKDAKGKYLLIDVPKLQYWDMIYIEK